MGKDKIRLKIGQSEIIVKKNGKLNFKNEDSLGSSLLSIFNTIKSSDLNGDDGKVDSSEFQLFKKLFSILRRDDISPSGNTLDISEEDLSYINTLAEKLAKEDLNISEVLKEHTNKNNEKKKVEELFSTTTQTVTVNSTETIVADNAPTVTLDGTETIVADNTQTVPVNGTQTIVADNTQTVTVDGTEANLASNAISSATEVDAEALAQAEAEALAQAEAEALAKIEKQKRLDAYNEKIQTQVNKLGDGYKPADDYHTIYTIKSGDTLYGIAKRELGGNPTMAEINARIAEIAKMNNIKNVNVIRVGQKIRLTKLGETQNYNVSAPKDAKKTTKETQKVDVPKINLSGVKDLAGLPHESLTNNLIEDALKQENNFNVDVYKNSDGNKIKRIALNDDRWISATYDENGNITKIELNLKSNKHYNNDSFVADIIVSKNLMEYNGDTKLYDTKNLMEYDRDTNLYDTEKSAVEGFNFEEFVKAFEAIDDHANKLANNK